jgi:hypothetical protein
MVLGGGVLLKKGSDWKGGEVTGSGGTLAPEMDIESYWSLNGNKGMIIGTWRKRTKDCENKRERS